MNSVVGKSSHSYTVSDYLSGQGDERYVQIYLQYIFAIAAAVLATALR